jgi:hypothetical protein
MNTTSVSVPSAPRLAGFRTGDHVCHPFLDETERDAALIPYIREGLLRGERCVFAAAPAVLARTEERLRAVGIDVARARQRHALLLIPPAETYGQQGAFDPDRTIANLGALLDGSLADGFSGFRGIGEVDRSLSADEAAALRAYEAKVSAAFAGRPFTALCNYPRHYVSDAEAVALLHSHPHVWVDGEVRSNPYFDGEPIPGAPGAPPRQRDFSLGLDDTLDLIGRQAAVQGHDRRLAEALAAEAGTLNAALTRSRSAATDLITALEGRDQFVAEMADALERPLAPVRSELRQIRRSLQQEPPAPTLLGQIERLWHELRQLEMVSRGVREVARLLQPQPPLEAVDLDLVEVMRAVALRHRHVLEEAETPLELHVCRPGQPVQGRWDQALLERMLGNVLDFVAEHGTGPARAEIGWIQGRARVAVTVEVGDAARARAAVFRLPDPQRAHGGEPESLSSLWIATRLAAALGGDLTADIHGARATLTVVL